MMAYSSQTRSLVTQYVFSLFQDLSSRGGEVGRVTDTGRCFPIELIEAEADWFIGITCQQNFRTSPHHISYVISRAKFIAIASTC